jgi:outer membrane receptor protein involved in Fe transport
MTLDLIGFRDRQDWGSPLPFDAGELLPGFVIDRNYAVGGAEIRHQVGGGTSRLTWPLGPNHRLENTLGLTHDDQDYVRSFPGEVSGDTLESEGLELEPTEISFYDDVRWIARLRGAGSHELVAGAAVTWGRTKGEGREFSFDQLLSRYPEIPSVDQIAGGEDREFEDRRTFLGAYLHDAWTPTGRLTLEGGGRFDATSEELETEADLPSGPTPLQDEREDADFSGDLSALFRLVPEGGARPLEAANLYASIRRAFKPAAPNLAEAEAAEILEPERTTSWEVGLKARAFDGVALELSYFDMTFENLVVSILGAGGLPELTNAGEERFRGFESTGRWSPAALPGSALSVGYAHHDARFVDFTFVTPTGELRDVSGKKLELVPRDLLNGRAALRTSLGMGGFVAARYQGARPFNRRNTFFADAFTEWDAGLSYDRGRWRVAVVGRNLGDDRHVVTESEIGDAQFYVAPPRRFTAEVGYRF